MSKVQSTQLGFTIIELVIVVIIIGVLAVSAAARLGDTQQFLTSAYQAELANALRAVQGRAMQDTRGGICHRINFVSSPSGTNNSQFGTPTRNYTLANAVNTCAATIDAGAEPGLSTEPGELAREDIRLNALDGAGNTLLALQFNAMGQPFSPAGGVSCAPQCRLTLASSLGHAVCLNTEGYIYEC